MYLEYFVTLYFFLVAVALCSGQRGNGNNLEKPKILFSHYPYSKLLEDSRGLIFHNQKCVCQVLHNYFFYMCHPALALSPGNLFMGEVFRFQLSSLKKEKEASPEGSTGGLQSRKGPEILQKQSLILDTNASGWLRTRPFSLNHLVDIQQKFVDFIYETDS